MLNPVSQPYQKRENTMTQRAVRKPKPSVGNQLRQSFPQRHWLELAEYASLAAFGVGSLAVAVSSQAFYGVAPLTLALSLNVVTGIGSSSKCGFIKIWKSPKCKSL